MSRSIRIGIVLRDRLVEERIFSDPAPITIGQSLRCALSIPSDGLPREHVLFDRSHTLQLAPGMTGRIRSGDAITHIDRGSIPLTRGARGKLSIGDVTILFQEIATPPTTPRPKLPASIRGTFADRIDRRLAVILGASLVAHVAVAAWAWSTDLETTILGQPSIAEYRQDTIDVMLPDHAEPPAITAPGIAAPVIPITRIVPVRTPGRAAASDPQQLAQDATRMASILTGDDGHHGFGGMNHRQPGADLDRQIDDARNHTVTIGDGGHTSRTDDRARIGTDPDRTIPLDDPRFVTATPRAEARPPRIQLLPVATDTKTTLTPAAVLEKIQNVYMASLQRCYRLGLGEDATLSGKVAIDFTVESHGRVTDPEAIGLSTKVDSCIAGVMASWHFPRRATTTASPPTPASRSASCCARRADGAVSRAMVIFMVTRAKTVPATISAAEFKAKCLDLMDSVAATGASITVTKRGRPVAILSPVHRPQTSAFGCLKGKIRILGDIISPIDVTWDATK